MQIIKYPKREDWSNILERPIQKEDHFDDVKAIVQSVRTDGDSALFRYSELFDGVRLTELKVNREELNSAAEKVSFNLKNAILNAKSNIETFHAAYRENNKTIATTPGVFCWRRAVPIDRVGIYIPSGSAPLFSTVLMLAAPANLAGCKEIVMCAPPDKDGKIEDTILFAAQLCGVTDIYKIGGAQAIAAMAYGTETIHRVFKIFGPGNQFVTSAKKIVSADVPIDMPAGPSEVAILADSSCDASFVAADLLAQAEHGEDSQVIFVSNDERVLTSVVSEIDQQLPLLTRRDIATAALRNSKAILMENVEAGLDLLNDYAAEHLILAVENAEEIALGVKNAGSVFIGNYSCESAGDYATGTNHTLPTGGFARSYSGVSLDSFVKKITFQKLTSEGIKNIGPAVELMAAAEGLDAHKNAVSIRLEKLT